MINSCLSTFSRVKLKQTREIIIIELLAIIPPAIPTPCMTNFTTTNPTTTRSSRTSTTTTTTTTSSLATTSNTENRIPPTIRIATRTTHGRPNWRHNFRFSVIMLH